MREYAKDNFENNKGEVQCDPDREGGAEAFRRMRVSAVRLTRRMVVHTHFRSSLMITMISSTINKTPTVIQIHIGHIIIANAFGSCAVTSCRNSTGRKFS